MLITYKITTINLGILFMIFILQGCFFKTSENPQSNNDDIKNPTTNKMISIGKSIYLITSLFLIITQKCELFNTIKKLKNGGFYNVKNQDAERRNTNFRRRL